MNKNKLKFSNVKSMALRKMNAVFESFNIALRAIIFFLKTIK